MDVLGRRTADADLRGTVMPSADAAEVVRVPQVIQAALFYLEAAAIAVSLAALTGTFLFAVLAQITKFTGIEQSGDALNIVLWGLVAAASLATLFTVFIAYFRLLVHPIAGRIVCAVGSLVWALPVGLAASMLLHVLPWFARVIVTWIVLLAVAAGLYWLKRQIVRM